MMVSISGVLTCEFPLLLCLCHNMYILLVSFVDDRFSTFSDVRGRFVCIFIKRYDTRKGVRAL